MSRANGRNGHPILRTIIVLLLVVVIGFGGWMGLSLKRVGDLLGQASMAYEQVEASIEAEDYENALLYARTTASLTSQVSDELEGVQWEIASNIPVLGTDATAVRSIGRIAGTLSDDAILPALDSWDALVSDGVMTDGMLDTTKLVGKIDQVGALATTLQEAGKVADACTVEMDSLPTSHFDAVNQWADQLRGTIISVDETLDQFSLAIDLVAGFSDTLSSFTTT